MQVVGVQFLYVQFKHCYCANVLARIVTEQKANFISFDCPPVDIRNILEFDLSGVYSNRLCPELNVTLLTFNEIVF